MLSAVNELPGDLRSAYRRALRGEPLPAVADCHVGLAILQLAANKPPKDVEFGPDAMIEVSSNGVQKSLRELAIRYIARTQLRHGQNHYALLGLTRDATSEQVKDHYRRLIALVHPDVRPDEFPVDAAAQVNLAYETLSDDERRQAYDRSDTITRPTEHYSEPHRTPFNVTEQAPHATRFAWLQSRNMLVWGAAALVLSVALLLFSFGTPPRHPEIVVAKPRHDAVQLRGSDTLAQKAVGEPPTAAPVVTVPAKPSGSPASVSLNASTSLSLVAPAQEPDREPSVRDARPKLEPNVRTVTARSDSEVMVEKSLQPVPNRDALAVVDEFLVMLSESIEAGQPERFARLFSADVVGRSKVVTDFAQVFEATKRREIRFVKIDRFRPVNGAPTFAGQIELVMTSNDGISSRQQMFVQGSVHLQRGKPVLTSWSSHPI